MRREEKFAYHWLLVPGAEDTRDTSVPSFQEMAGEVLKALQEGEIFFIVQDSPKYDVTVNSGIVIAKMPDSRERKGVALIVKSGVTAEQLLEDGDASLEDLYTLHDSNRFDQGRFVASDPIKLKMEGFGRFPDIFREK